MAHSPSRLRRVRRRRSSDLPHPFRQLWLGKSASSLSDFVLASALPILTAITTESAALVAAVTTALTLPWLLFGLTAGALVDRIDRRHALIGSGLLRTGVFALAAILAAAGLLPDAALLIGAVVTGIGQVISETATLSITPQLVASRQLERANARLITAEVIVEAAAALVAGTLASGGALAVFGTGALCGLAGLIALSRLLRLYLPLAPETVTPSGAPPRSGMLDGLRLLWAIPVLRVIALMGAVINTAWTAFAATFVLYAIAPGPIGLSPQRYSLLLTASIGGGILGGLFAPRLLARVGNRWGIGLNILANAVTFGTPALTTSPWLIGIVFFTGDTATPLWRVTTATLQQRAVPEALRGRVLAAYRVISYGAAVAGPATGVAIAGQIGSRGLFAVAAGACLLMLIPFQRVITHRAMAGIEGQVLSAD